MTITSPYTPASFNGSGTTGPFSFSFRILDKTHIKVEKVVGTTVTTLTEGVGAGQYSIVLVAAGLSGGQITLGTALANGERLIVSRVTPRTQLEKLADLRRFNAEIHERAFDKATMVIQETEYQGSAAVKFPTADTPGLNQTLPVDSARANKVMGFNGTGEPIVTDLTVAQLNDFAQAVVDVEAAAADAQADAATATTQAGIATTQAGIAVAAVEGIPYRDVVFLTFANSPYTMTNADRGKMFSIDTSGGNFVFNLAQISTLTMPFTVGIKKATSDANTITINRAGTDLIDAATSYVISTVAGVNLVGDTDGTPDKWTSAAFGAGAGEQKVQTFTGGVDYTGGSTTTLTLTNTPVSPSSAALEVFFDGVAQHPSEWTYNPGTGVITFTSAIPVGVVQVFTRWASSSVLIGTPSDGTVTWAKLASALIASLSDWASGTADKILTASNFLAALSAAIGFSKRYTSAAQAISLGTPITVTHGLGGVPDFAYAKIICTSADGDFAVGDVMFVYAADRERTANPGVQNQQGMTLKANATQIIAYIGSSQFMPVITSTGGWTTLDPAKWNMILMGWR